nr:glycosyltransferase family 9 protein [uncultured Pseudodesulfovibrio sp.]
MIRKLCHGYLYNNKAVVLLLSCIDGVMRRLAIKKRGMPRQIRSILVVKPDHLGDLLLTSSVLPLLRKRFPDSRIDMVVNSGSLPVIRDSTIVDHVFVVDHWMLNRSKASLWHKLIIFMKSFYFTIREVRKVEYDLCLNLRAFGGNLVTFCGLSGSRYCVGHGTGGGGWFFDEEVPWIPGKHEVEHYLEVLAPLGIEASLEELRCEMSVSESVRSGVRDMVVERELSPFVIFQPGSGATERMLPSDVWAATADALPEGVAILVCGTADEGKLGLEIQAMTDRRLHNYTGHFQLEELLSLYGEASVVFALESLSAHLGGTSGTQTIAYYRKGESSPEMWRPLGDNVRIVDTSDQFIQSAASLSFQQR